MVIHLSNQLLVTLLFHINRTLFLCFVILIILRSVNKSKTPTHSTWDRIPSLKTRDSRTWSTEYNEPSVHSFIVFCVLGSVSSYSQSISAPSVCLPSPVPFLLHFAKCDFLQLNIKCCVTERREEESHHLLSR